MRLIERLWYGDSALDRAGRAVLTPLEIVFRGASQLRSTLYDAGVLRSTPAPVPVISVGNLTVGGTGKTPVAAWIVYRLRSAGMSPAIVMRGYGGDEPMVHGRLNPGTPVIVSADRNAGIRDAVDAGADVVVLDDAFQHRRASRDVDVVLISADDWTGRKRLLPSGPFREPFGAIARASCVLVTCKVASDANVERVKEAVHASAANLPLAVVRLEPESIVSRDGTHAPLASLKGKHVVAVSAVGNNAAFFRQLALSGAAVTAVAFPDHHSFSRGDVTALRAAATGADYIVCTLKDAVKLEGLWPADDSRLWYVSLAVNVEHGETVIDEMLERLHQRRAQVIAPD